MSKHNYDGNKPKSSPAGFDQHQENEMEEVSISSCSIDVAESPDSTKSLLNTNSSPPSFSPPYSSNHAQIENPYANVKSRMKNKNFKWSASNSIGSRVVNESFSPSSLSAAGTLLKTEQDQEMQWLQQGYSSVDDIDFDKQSSPLQYWDWADWYSSTKYQFSQQLWQNSNWWQIWLQGQSLSYSQWSQNYDEFQLISSQNKQLRQRIWSLEREISEKGQNWNQSMDDSEAGLDSFWSRITWLVGLLAFQSLSSIILERFHFLLAVHPTVVYFLTMLVGAGGNCGSQSAIIVIRELATLQSWQISIKGKDKDQQLWQRQQSQQLKVSISLNEAWRMIRHQLLCGFKMASVCALASFVRCYAFQGTSFNEGVALSVSMFCIVQTAAVIGALLPILLALYGVDPGHAGAAIQVFMDISGVLLTCVVCSLILLAAGQQQPGQQTVIVSGENSSNNNNMMLTQVVGVGNVTAKSGSVIENVQKIQIGMDSAINGSGGAGTGIGMEMQFQNGRRQLRESNDT